MADELAALGRSLAGRADWWGAAQHTPGSSAITVRPGSADGHYTVRVNDAIGVIVIDGRSVPVHPKIPTAHALHLLELGGALPRLSSLRAGMDSGLNFFELVSRWYLAACEEAMRSDLIRDYETRTERIGYVRGRIDVPRTSLTLLQGRPTILCEFDDLTTNNPLNRALRAALRVVARSPIAEHQTKIRSSRLLTRFDDVGELRPSDLSAHVERRTTHLTDALQLAKLLISGSATSLETGGGPAWAFLIRTPEFIEAGVRNSLQRQLIGRHRVAKRALALPSSARTINPDLVFNDGQATGDIKYKLAYAYWSTADLYQAVAFATGFHVDMAAIISFGSTPLPQKVVVGDVSVTGFEWPLDTTPEEAASALAGKISDWLGSAARDRPVSTA